ncbi:MAG: S8 family serine peptidase [Verrucomicrobiales bacterium]|nr:S8 family serine peptidase [Verrucomicrobiales bacterium]
MRNTSKPLEVLLRDERALVLRNAHIDTAENLDLGIPEDLRAGPEPGAYIVQAKNVITPSFKATIEEAGGAFVSYLPNNAYLVKATTAQAEVLKKSARVGAVLPYEPYYKLETELLSQAVSQQPLQQDTRLNVTLLPGARSEALTELQIIGTKIIGDFKTPFGPGVVVELASASLASIARISSVQEIELFRQRRLLNDLTRVRLGISSATNVPGAFSNRFNLTGTNVVFNLNDSGVDATHPDLLGRVTADFPTTLIDFDGHGTHTAGTIIGSGSMSATISNAPGSTLPGADFRGIAPEAEIFALPIDLLTGPLLSDAYLQERAATNYYVERGQTNFPISNNSWEYSGDTTYNLSAASYDAAVRDALPEMSGNQPILYVFAAGNSGSGNDNGLEGDAGSISAPGTAKNVITVGAIESPRNITNEVILPDPEDPTRLLTNQVFLTRTDSDYQVTAFSSRGNVGRFLEGTFGRFKPDVVAPGESIISTRSHLWEDPTAEFGATVNTSTNQEVKPGELVNYSLLIPTNIYQFYVDVLPNQFSPIPFPTLPLYLRYGDFPTVSDLISTDNSFAVPPDRAATDGIWYYAVGNPTDSTISYDIRSVIIYTNVPGNYYEVLKSLNDGLRPYYRYERGTSMAAPAVSGLVGLFLDYFQKQGQVVSPALLKALLINGSRSLGSLYNYAVRDVINYQGWGVANLTNVLPATPFGVSTGGVSLVQFAEVTGQNSLATGESRSWSLDIDPQSVNRQLKITLVWTDPPGNPSAGAKLVNDLDLVLRSGDTNEFILGNELQFGDDFNLVWNDANSGTNDIVNNVESILVRAPLKTNYVLTVKAKRVNVNAVSGHLGGIVQDFALVASVNGDATTNVLKVTVTNETQAPVLPFVRSALNGVDITKNRVGAERPDVGTQPGTFRQWNFFVFTNTMESTPPDSGLTNGAHLTADVISEANISSPRVWGPDLDLYVSTNSALTNLSAAALATAWRPLYDGHALESVMLTNAELGVVYYAAVKSEDQKAGDYIFRFTSTDTPLDMDDGKGNRIVFGRPFFKPVPDGSALEPQEGIVIGHVTVPFKVKRVVVTNTLEFDSTGDIVTKLQHGAKFSVLNNHALDPANRARSVRLVYDDSGEGDVGFGNVIAQPTDGPGSLMDFVGEEAAGPWVLRLIDNATAQTATNRLFSMWIERQPELGEWIFVEVPPFSWERSSWEVPSGATELKVTVSRVEPPADQDVYIRKEFPPTSSQFDKFGTVVGADGGAVSLGLRDSIPLNRGLYHVGIYNDNAVTVVYGYRVDIAVGPFVPDRSFDLDLPQALTDDARQFSKIVVEDDREIVDVKVGLRVDHPRVSDLVFHLTSPRGTRLLLSENRGGPNGVAYGATLGLTNIYTTFTDDSKLTATAIKYGIPPFTNNAVLSVASNRIVFKDGFESAVPGTYSLPQSIPVAWQVTLGTASIIRVPVGDEDVLEGQQYLVLGSTENSGVGTTVQLSVGKLYRLRFGAGKTLATGLQGVSVYVNGVLQQEVRGDTHPVGWYRDSVVFRAPADICLIEFRTTLGLSPLALDEIVIEEEDPPFNAYYFPEEELQPFLGQRALGDWRLEVTDTRAGPGGSGPAKVDWRLEFVYALPSVEAIQLTNGVPYFGTVDGNDVKYFFTQVPACATISRSIIAGEFATLFLFGDHDGLPYADANTFQDDYGPYLNVEPGGIAQFFLATNFPASGPLRPGQRYYLAVRNYRTDLTNNAFGIMVNFDCDDPPLPVVDSLFSGIPRTNTIAAGPALQYYQFVVSSNAIRAEFELTPVNGNVDMYIRQGRVGNFPVPSPSVYDYKSDDPDPAVVDFVNVDRTSPPVGLTPGVWYVAVRNGETFPVDYTIKATEFTAQIINLTNAIPYTNTIAAVDPAIGLLGEDLQYYAFLVSQDSIRANFETLGADGDVNLYLRKTLPIPTPFDFDLASQSPGVADEFIAVTNTATPIWLSPGWWFLSVENADVTNITYSIKATEFPATIIPLTNNVAFTNVIAPGTSLDYYSFLVSTQVLSAKFEVFGMSDDVQLLLRQGLPVPTFNDFHYASTNAGLANEEIALTPYSFPTTLTPGNWYLSIANASSNNATYVVRASEETALVVPLTNGVPYNASLPAGPGVDYFQFTVSSNATAAEFKVTSAGTGDLDLYLKKGPPLPNALNAI